MGAAPSKAKSAQLGCGFGVGGRTFVEYCDNIDLIIPRTKPMILSKSTGRLTLKLPTTKLAYGRAWKGPRYLPNANEGTVFRAYGYGRYFHVHRLDSERYWLICTLPSGRHIAYYRPKIRLGKLGDVPLKNYLSVLNGAASHTARIRTVGNSRRT
jgi:hypothetical protein